MKKLQDQLKSVSKSLASLSKQVDKITKQVESLQAKPKAAAKKKPAKKAAAKKAKARKKAPAKKAAAKKKAKQPTVLETVYAAVKSTRAGAAIAQIKKKTDLSARQLSNALYKLTKQGKIVAASRGVYKKK